MNHSDLCVGGQRRKFDFSQVFHFETQYCLLNLKSISKMCSFDVEYVDAAQKMCG